MIFENSSNIVALGQFLDLIGFAMLAVELIISSKVSDVRSMIAFQNDRLKTEAYKVYYYWDNPSAFPDEEFRRKRWLEIADHFLVPTIQSAKRRLWPIGFDVRTTFDPLPDLEEGNRREWLENEADLLGRSYDAIMEAEYVRARIRFFLPIAIILILLGFCLQIYGTLA